jgi:hypothetical protein
VNSGRSCVLQLGLEVPNFPVLRQVVFSEESWRGVQVGVFLVSRWEFQGGSPKPGLTFGDPGLNFTSTLRVTTSPFPSVESR